jgi:hypothetical protein
VRNEGGKLNRSEATRSGAALVTARRPPGRRDMIGCPTLFQLLTMRRGLRHDVGRPKLWVDAPDVNPAIASSTYDWFTGQFAPIAAMRACSTVSGGAYAMACGAAIALPARPRRRMSRSRKALAKIGFRRALSKVATRREA